MMKYERFTWKTEKLQHLDDEVIMVVDNANKDWKGHILNIVDMLNELNDENKELKLQLEAFKDKLCELGVSDVKLYGKRYYTGLEEWLE